MKVLFDFILNLGVSTQTSFDSRKRIRFTNAISFLCLVLIFFLLIFFAYWGATPSITLGLMGLFVLMCIPLILSFFQLTIAGRLVFLFFAYVALVVLPWTFGEQSGFHLYLIPGFGMPLLFFRNEIRWHKWLLAFFIFPCLGFVQWYFHEFPDRYVEIPVSYEVISLMNECFVLITIAIMFVLFIAENNKHIDRISKQRNRLLAFEYSRSASIRYAESIQKSILPPDQLMNNMLPGHFTYYKPKDIVSGDFYWVKEKLDRRYVAVVDCTGHGVPGSLLSMMVNSLLDAILLEHDQPSPSRVLSLLHKKIFQTLHQDSVTENTMDGCDISIITLDPHYQNIRFAGANSNLYLLRGDELQVCKGESVSVGGLNNDGIPSETKTFKEHEISLEPNDMVVLTTDGILDQINNEYLNFGNQGFEKMLKELSNSEIQNKASYVDSTIRTWKQDNNQLDDYLLIGLTIPNK